MNYILKFRNNYEPKNCTHIRRISWILRGVCSHQYLHGYSDFIVIYTDI